jgi:hypothetical protein
MFEHIPKINVGLGCLVLVCFFLPWISFSCGTTTIVSLSGFNLALGKTSVDAAAIRQYEQLGGNAATDARIPQELRRKAPRYLYFLVPLFALNVVAFSLRMMKGGMTRFMLIGTMVSGGAGSLFLLGAGIAEFGMELPPGTVAVIQSSLEPGYFLSLLFMVASALLPVALWRTVEETRAALAAATTPIQKAPPPEFIGGPEPVSPAMAEFFGMQEQKKKDDDELEVRPTLPPGTKACPGCGIAVGAYQVKCVKCGTALKPTR